jgi:hypothetical protein
VVDEGISESFQRPCPEPNFQRSHRVAETRDYTPPSAFGRCPDADGSRDPGCNEPMLMRCEGADVTGFLIGCQAARRKRPELRLLLQGLAHLPTKVQTVGASMVVGDK